MSENKLNMQELGEDELDNVNGGLSFVASNTVMRDSMHLNASNALEMGNSLNNAMLLGNAPVGPLSGGGAASPMPGKPTSYVPDAGTTMKC